jgi:hypothetical protein
MATTIDQVRDLARHVLDSWPQPPAVAQLDALNPDFLWPMSAATIELIAKAHETSSADALEVGIRIGWTCARAATTATDEVDAWAREALKRRPPQGKVWPFRLLHGGLPRRSDG